MIWAQILDLTLPDSRTMDSSSAFLILFLLQSEDNDI